MHTEEEARKLWCPMVRFVIGPETSKWQGVAYTNRCDELNHPQTNCIASSCAMWVFNDPVVMRKSDGHICYRDPKSQYPESEWEEVPQSGSCGLIMR